MIALIALVIGGIYPKAIRQTSRLQVLKIYGLATFILFVMIGVLAPKQNNTTPESVVEKKTAADSPSETLKIKIAQEPAPKPKPMADKKEVPNLSEEKTKYKIVKDDSLRDVKRTVEVVLKERIEEDLLLKIAQQIYDNRSHDYERTFIGYRIEGEDAGPYWATTNYNPNLEINFIGTKKQEHEKLIAQKANDLKDVIGIWLSQNGPEHKMVAYKKNGKVFIRYIYHDGSSFEEQHKLTTHKGLKKLQDESGKSFGEYFLINAKGELEFWGKNGNYYTAKPI